MKLKEKVANQIADQISDYLLKGAIINSLNTPSISADEAPIIKPYAKLSELLGSFLGQVNVGEQNIISVKIEFDGKASEISSSILSSVFCGIFKSHIDTVNIINSIQIAKQKGLEISTINHDRKCDYQNLTTVTVNYENKSQNFRTLIGGKIPRITEVQGIPIEANFFTNMLYIRTMISQGLLGPLVLCLQKKILILPLFI